MALPILATLSGTAALAAYLNAKHHILYDLTHARGGLAPTPSAEAYMASRVASKRLLTYHVFEEQALHKRPHHPFLIFEGRTWTYRQFYDAVVSVGNWLMSDLGVQEGEVVAIDGGNSPEYYMLWFALDAVGAVVSFVNWNLTGEGLVHCVKICGSRYLLTDSDVRSNVEPSLTPLSDLGVTIHYYTPSFFASLTDDTPLPESRRENATLESTRGLIYTSGTTGLPKGVIMPTGRELFVGHQAATVLKLKPEDRMYTCMPLYHGAAHGLCTTPCIHAGATIVLGRKFSHRTFWPEVARSRATHIQYVGELCRYLLNGPPNDFETQHCVKVAWGNGMRPDVWEPFRQRFKIPVIHELYAATDGLGSTFNANAGPFTRHAIGLRGLLWNWRFGEEEVRVRMDVDTEEIVRDERGFAVRVGPGEPGQVLHRLDPEMLAGVPGYFNNEEATGKRRIADVFQEGDLYFQSGDLMRQDASGLLFFVDRLGDTYRWKSENVSTHEVSDALGKFPSIAETNAYGVSVPGYDGRAGAASIVLAPGVSEAALDLRALAAHARSALPGYAVPLFLRVTERLEYTGTLKIQKGRLKREGVDPGLVTGTDRVYWLKPGEEGYLPFGRKDWEDIKAKRVRLT
ncbi:acetyl-CoA synthetase-like protein [Lophiostoma macrostomum CBS 122681]|uniref:Very long-chain fatty acid transport protein n=1 Tax=Lophiostoma macrostomum CBS 122681 TaxID=1314788 RepID=A0A6A6T3Y3_9PLEO|nr:acetyl-CoA synthetase-like protein [Lophiostoma macrostomum CBS 122681]